jgi:hypothetical protein
MEKVERLFRRHPESDDGPVDDAIHRVVELSREYEGDRHDRGEARRLFENRRDRGLRRVGGDEAESPELGLGRDPHRRESSAAARAIRYRGSRL